MSKKLEEIIEEKWVIKNGTNLKTISKEIAIEFSKQLLTEIGYTDMDDLLIKYL